MAGERGDVGGVIDEDSYAGIDRHGAPLGNEQPGDVAALVRLDEHGGAAGIFGADKLLDLAFTDEVANLGGTRTHRLGLPSSTSRQYLDFLADFD